MNSISNVTENTHRIGNHNVPLGNVHNYDFSIWVDVSVNYIKTKDVWSAVGMFDKSADVTLINVASV